MKLVLNKCYGGYGLSSEAITELYKQGSKAVKFSTFSQYFGRKWKSMTQAEKDRELDFSTRLLSAVVLEDGIVTQDSSWDVSIRSCPKLVKLVEDWGDKANSRHSKLEVVEVPDGLDLQFDEYDGIEFIEEVHRSW